MTSGMLLLVVEVSVRDGVPSCLYKYAFRLQEKPFSSIKVHPILDRIGYLLNDIIL